MAAKKQGKKRGTPGKGSSSVGRAGAQKATKANQGVDIEDYEHSDAKRTNNPPAGLAHLDREETPVRTLSYDPISTPN